ncbi:MAG: hypothetical protein GWN44_03570 [Calditrichae bacterium]|nr:hypothetical protein [Calditrichia bacterium]
MEVFHDEAKGIFETHRLGQRGYDGALDLEGDRQQEGLCGTGRSRLERSGTAAQICQPGT